MGAGHCEWGVFRPKKNIPIYIQNPTYFKYESQKIALKEVVPLDKWWVNWLWEVNNLFESQKVIPHTCTRLV